MPSIDLTDEEVVLLDGKFGPKVQEEVNAAADRIRAVQELPGLTPRQAKMVATIVAVAEKDGYLEYSPGNVRGDGDCPCCGKSPGFAVYDRTSINHQKGEPNQDRPNYMNVVHLQRSWIMYRCYVGACLECLEKIKPDLIDRLASVKAEIPEKLTGYPPKWRKVNQCKCRKCGWVGWDLQRSYSFDYYGGKSISCPKCFEFGSWTFDHDFTVKGLIPTSECWHPAPKTEPVASTEELGL